MSEVRDRHDCGQCLCYVMKERACIFEPSYEISPKDEACSEFEPRSEITLEKMLKWIRQNITAYELDIEDGDDFDKYWGPRDIAILEAIRKQLEEQMAMEDGMKQ